MDLSKEVVREFVADHVRLFHEFVKCNVSISFDSEHRYKAFLSQLQQKHREPGKSKEEGTGSQFLSNVNVLQPTTAREADEIRLLVLCHLIKHPSHYLRFCDRLVGGFDVFDVSGWDPSIMVSFHFLLLHCIILVTFIFFFLVFSAMLYILKLMIIRGYLLMLRDYQQKLILLNQRSRN